MSIGLEFSTHSLTWKPLYRLVVTRENDTVARHVRKGGLVLTLQCLVRRS